MSTLIMVRHGQASFGDADYDKLSELGIEQSSTLGKYWAERGQNFDAVFSGVQVRQKHTLEEVRDAYNAAKLDFPEPVLMEAFNEYDFKGIMMHYFPKLLETDKNLQEIVKSSAGIEGNSAEGRKAFQRAYAIIMEYWLGGKIDIDEVESWERFRDRVIAGIKKVVAEYKSGKTVVVFTSGGAISVALQYALQMPDKIALNLGWVVKNGSITEFMYSGDMFTLAGFNMTPHFDEDSLVTYR